MDNQRINLIFTLDELTVINEAIVQLPFFKVASLINSINKQISEQMEEKNTSSTNENA